MPQHNTRRAALAPDTNTPRDYFEIGAAFVILVGLLYALNQLDLLPQRLAISEETGFAFIFAIGLVASISSCMAVTGGLLVAIAAKYNDASRNLTGWQRLKPHLYFNTGRVISYTLLGGAIGALGATLTLSPMINGVLSIAASAVFGARAGLAPIIFGAVLLVLAVGFAEHAAAPFALIPIGAVGSLLIFAGTDLAISRRLFNGKPSCLWVIGTTALVTVTVNPALGLVLGWVAELIRAAIVRRLIPERPRP